jgi:serine/threonine protein kinase
MRSGLLDREQLKTTLRSLPKDSRDQLPAIADHLVEADKLTRFQVYKIAQGITVGLVLGPYHLLAPIGRGGMGTVYLARDTRSGQHVALKILPPKIAREQERLPARFQREMELSQKIQHPNIARTLEAGVVQNIHYIAMEYIPGQTLYRLVMSKGVLSVQRAAYLFAEVASALGYAHSQGVIHRDMKPSNIMVTPHDHAKVLDLGLAYTEGEEVEDIEVVGGKGYIVGSIDYMAPEQTRDSTSVDGRADLYALGCCIYFALTGKPPFPEGSMFEKVRAQRHDPPEPLRTRNSLVPEEFAAIVDRLMSKSPKDRYNSAGEFAVALANFRGDAPLPLDVPGDAEYQQSVKDVVANWTPVEPAKEQAVEDAVLFRVETDEKRSEVLARSIFADIDRVQMRIWLLLVLAGLWVGLLLLCVLATCVFSMTR